ncbi:hypothetical protein LCGC14_1203130 [marine sediment metagenome]|uniref:Uncharacterized protein n=1 Tax=marine sediment metagenome TaxID=412755 RepID=A0A0F9LKP8_9ZZZZ
MPTVDDLIISLRIDETSNLGKLQKQLTALVGPKGDKPILGAGIDASLKRDISIIKGRLEYITHIAPGIDMGKLALSAGALYTTLKDPQAFKNILGKLGQNEEWLRDIQEILIGIETGTTEMKATKIAALLPLLQKAIAQSPAMIGDVRKLVTDITEAVEEFIRQKQLQEIFKDFGLSVREYYIAMSKPIEDVNDILKDNKNFQTFLEEQKKVLGTEKFNELVTMIKELKDPIKVLGKFKDINILEFTKLPEKLKPLAAAYMEVMKTEQVGVIDLMREFFQKIKKSGKGLTQKLESSSLDFLTTIDVWKQVLEQFKGKGLEFLGGINVPETARYVGIELEKGTTAGYVREMRERIRKFEHTIMLFLKTNTNLDKHIDSLDKTSEETKNSYTAMEVEIGKIREQAGKALTPEEMEELNKKSREEFYRKQDENTLKAMEKVKAQTEEVVEDYLGGAIKDAIEGAPVTKQLKYVETAEEKQDREMMELMKEINETTDDTNAEVKKKDTNNEPKVVPEDE